MFTTFTLGKDNRTKLSADEYLEYVVNHIFLTLMCNVGVIRQALQQRTDALLAAYTFSYTGQSIYVKIKTSTAQAVNHQTINSDFDLSA